MSLPASGALSSTDILTELNLTAGTSISSADQRIKHLANKDSGSLISTDFYGRLPIRLVDQTTSGTSGLTHTFSSVDFGPTFTGRILVACPALYSSTNNVLDQQTCTIAGNSAAGADAGSRSSTTGNAAGSGIWFISDETNTSGDVVFTWTSGTSQGTSLFMLSVDAMAIPQSDRTTDWFTTTSDFSGTDASDTTDVPADGILLVSFAQAADEDCTLTNSTERHDQSFGSASARHTIGYDNKLSAETNRTITATWTTTTTGGGSAQAFSEA